MASFKSFLSAAGHDFVAVFKWLGSTQGQNAINNIEKDIVVVGSLINPLLGPAISGIEDLINSGLRQVLSIEASAAAVGAQTGTGAQKGVAVVASLAGKVGALLASVGISNPTEEQIQKLSVAVSQGLTDIVNAIPAPVAAQ